MNRAQLNVLANILEIASEEFSNHGCNDFNLAEQGLTPEEIESFKAGFIEYMKADDSEYVGPSGTYVQDNCVMRYLQNVVEKELRG